MEPTSGMVGDTRQNVREPGLAVYIVEFARDKEGHHTSSAFTAAIRTAEHPIAPANGQPSDTALGGIVGEADAPVINEAGERIPTGEHVVHGLGDVVAPGELGALLRHPILEPGEQGCAQLLAHGPSLLGALAVDLALDREEGVDALDGLKRDWREGFGVFTLSLFTRAGGKIGLLEQLAAPMRLARRFGDGARLPVGGEELQIAFVGVGLKNTGIAGHVGLRVLARSVSRIIEHGRGRLGAAEGPIISNVIPDPRR